MARRSKIDKELGIEDIPDNNVEDTPDNIVENTPDNNVETDTPAFNTLVLDPDRFPVLDPTDPPDPTISSADDDDDDGDGDDEETNGDPPVATEPLYGGVPLAEHLRLRLLGLR